MLHVFYLLVQDEHVIKASIEIMGTRPTHKTCRAEIIVEMDVNLL